LIKPTFKIDERFKKRVQARYERFDIQAGILEDKAHHEPRPARRPRPKGKKKASPSYRARGLGTLEGGPVRLQKRTTQSTTARIAERLRKELGVDWLRAPVRRYNSPEMKQLRKAFADLVLGKNRSYSVVEAKFRAVLRVPILRGRYGRNTRAAERVKTFNRKLIDTGQFFKAILAKVTSRKGKR